MRALIVVDVQNDFCEGGALPVAGGAAVGAAITAELIRGDYAAAPYAAAPYAAAPYDAVLATRDHHIDPGSHYSDEPDYVTTWPVHCRAGSTGAEPHPSLDVSLIDETFLKGQYSDGYSGFDGESADGRGLSEWLEEHGIDEVDVVGIATDHCVRATALDAVANGFKARVLLEFTAGVAPDTVGRALAQLEAAGVELIGTVGAA